MRKLNSSLYYKVTKLQITKYLKEKKGLMYIILYWSDYTTLANAITFSFSALQCFCITGNSL